MERRRLLDDEYINWLKSIGCVLYLPLSYDGDIMDRISGKSLQQTNYGSMTWSDTEQMYLFTMPSVLNASVATLGSSLSQLDFPSDDYSSLITMKMVTNSSQKYFATLSPKSLDQSTLYSTSASYNGSRLTDRFPHVVCKHAYVNDHVFAERRYYYDGNFSMRLAEHEPFLPSNWVMNGTGVLIACSINNQCYQTQYYASGIMLFNTVLDLQTIRKIQGYE